VIIEVSVIVGEALCAEAIDAADEMRIKNKGSAIKAKTTWSDLSFFLIIFSAFTLYHLQKI